MFQTPHISSYNQLPDWSNVCVLKSVHTDMVFLKQLCLPSCLQGIRARRGYGFCGDSSIGLCPRTMGPANILLGVVGRFMARPPCLQTDALPALSSVPGSAIVWSDLTVLTNRLFNGVCLSGFVFRHLDVLQFSQWLCVERAGLFSLSLVGINTSLSSSWLSLLKYSSETVLWLLILVWICFV